MKKRGVQGPFGRSYTQRHGNELFVQYHDWKTYEEFKKQLRSLLEENETVAVARTRRGEWGQWFEIWENRLGRPEIIKQTWL